MRTVLSLLVFFTGAIVGHAASPPSSDQRVYIFGNSLIHHQTKSDQTTVPHWLQQLSAADGTKFSASGQWGFLRNFIEGPPTDQWSFKQVRKSWVKQHMPFAKADLTTIIVNPANFIQYKTPDKPYDGENRTNESPLGATLKLFDMVSASHKAVTFYIYEGWAEAESVSKTFPLTREQLDTFHKLNQAAYHDWYVDYRDRVAAARPDLDVRLISVARILSKLLSSAPLNSLRFEELYSDLSPHGTAATYFLAAVITYTAIYGRPVPASFTVPDTLPAAIKDGYPGIRQTVCTELLPADQC